MRIDTRHHKPVADWPRPERLRCECPDCGIHTMALVGYKPAGNCPNCGAYGLIPISPEPVFRGPVRSLRRPLRDFVR